MASRGIVFLMYHELELAAGRPLCQSEPGYVRYILPEAAFRRQMNWLAHNGWRGLNVGEALSYPAGKSVAITFDDGCETDLITAAPVLRECGFHATFYVTAGFVGKPGYMSRPQVLELSSLGFEIGCHSMTHAYMNDLNPSDLRREIWEAGKELENMIGRKVEHFSCPGGRYNPRALDSARKAGYRSLATSHAHSNSPSTNPFLLGRVAVTRDLDDPTFGRVCKGEALKMMQFSDHMRGAARRALGNTLYDRLRTLMLGQRST